MLVNRTKEMQVIRIVSADGKRKDTVNLLRKVDLPAGWSVDPDYMAQYAAVMTDTSSAKKQGASSPAPAPQSKPAAK